MRYSLSVSLPEEVFKQLKTQSKKEQTTWSDVIRRALKGYFFRTEFEHLHQQAKLEAIQQGTYLSEEEIFKQVS